MHVKAGRRPGDQRRGTQSVMVVMPAVDVGRMTGQLEASERPKPAPAALKGLPPASRVTNLPGQNT
jgi:hypothetical protein